MIGMKTCLGAIFSDSFKLHLSMPGVTHVRGSNLGKDEPFPPPPLEGVYQLKSATSKRVERAASQTDRPASSTPASPTPASSMTAASTSAASTSAASTSAALTSASSSPAPLVGSVSSDLAEDQSRPADREIPIANRRNYDAARKVHQ